jgi:hypothetical protein
MSKQAKLYQLPNGDWCDPKTIVDVRAIDEVDAAMEKLLKAHIPPRVVIRHSGDHYSIREYATFELACQARDKVANDVNRACEAESEAGR